MPHPVRRIVDTGATNSRKKTGAVTSFDLWAYNSTRTNSYPNK